MGMRELLTGIGIALATALAVGTAVAGDASFLSFRYEDHSLFFWY
jgi:hypothetical protein